MLQSSDKTQIASHGLSELIVEGQINNFINGFTPSDLIKPALENDGILFLSSDEIGQAMRHYHKFREDKTIIKFVPASGAATRMFKTLFAFLSEFDNSQEAKEKTNNESSTSSMGYFLSHLKNFAFFHLLDQIIKTEDDPIEIVETLLNQNGLDYGQMPKGLLQFHTYEGSSRTPVEEHMVEGCEYAVDGQNRVNIHLTVSGEHKMNFEKHVAAIKSKYENEFGVSINVTYSQQKPSTDTIAVDMNNKPFRNEDGSLLFRPAGHGALLENLNDLDGDIIFLKNIDNVVPDRLKEETIKYKQVIAGILLQTQIQVFKYLERLDGNVEKELLTEINEFILAKLGYDAGRQLSSDELKLILNRPIRVCGMVKSEGDPGGGPFWVKVNDATTLQVVETAQIDLENEEQKKVFNQATHFNPVDVVCGVKNYRGEKFDLLKYRDPATGFISIKSKDGKDLKAQELPGLWNGAMANWNTIFIEVPTITFNPVKSVNDLLKPEHQ